MSSIFAPLAGTGPHTFTRTMMSYPVPLTSRLDIRVEQQPAPEMAQARHALVERYRARIEARHTGEEKVVAVPPPTQRHIVLTWASEPGQGVLSARQMAHAQGRTFDGEYYTFLMSHGVSSKTDSYVGYTTNPLRDVCLHNERKIPDRNTAAAAGNWELDIVLGPFACKALAIDCGNTWVHGTRGKIPKRKKAPWLSKAYSVNLYDCRQRLREPFDDFLQKHSPPVYSEVWHELCK